MFRADIYMKIEIKKVVMQRCRKELNAAYHFRAADDVLHKTQPLVFVCTFERQKGVLQSYTLGSSSGGFPLKLRP